MYYVLWCQHNIVNLWGLNIDGIMATDSLVCYIPLVTSCPPGDEINISLIFIYANEWPHLNLTLSRQSASGSRLDKMYYSLFTLLETRINLTCLSLDCGRKPVFLEDRHAGTGTTCCTHKLPQPKKIETPKDRWGQIVSDVSAAQCWKKTKAKI